MELGAQFWGPTAPGACRVLGAKKWPIKAGFLVSSACRGESSQLSLTTTVERVVMLVLMYSVFLVCFNLVEERRKLLLGNKYEGMF